MLIIFFVFLMRFFFGVLWSGEWGRVMRLEWVDLRILKGEMSLRKELI